MEKTKLIQVLKGVKEVQSRTGLTYQILNVTNDTILFKRSEVSECEKLSLEELLDFINSNKPVTTTNAREYISGRKQSPAVAIVDKIKTMI